MIYKVRNGFKPFRTYIFNNKILQMTKENWFLFILNVLTQMHVQNQFLGISQIHMPWRNQKKQYM